MCVELKEHLSVLGFECVNGVLGMWKRWVISQESGVVGISKEEVRSALLSAEISSSFSSSGCC